MLIRVWAENIRSEKHMFYHAETIEEAAKFAKALLAGGYKKAWIEIQQE